MAAKFIDIKIAKQELKRINSHLAEPALLIGGLAVHHYVPNRQSKDIDLYLNHDTTVMLIGSLYPQNEWTSEELNHDEERPHWVISKRADRSFPSIEIGPKISERDPYEFINWDQLLQEDTHAFVSPEGPLANIRVPRVEVLLYTKIISFLGRPEGKPEKREKDLEDISILSTRDRFNLPFFLNYVEENKAYKHIEANFNAKLSKVAESAAKGFLERSDFGRMARLFFASRV